MAEWAAALEEAYNHWSQEQGSKTGGVKRVGAVRGITSPSLSSGH